jgi:hypothetical protein
MAKNDLTADELRAWLDYDPETGAFTWKKKAGSRAMPGDQPGWISAHGYVRFVVAGVKGAAHQFAWLHVYGVWPSGDIDHINGIRSDNRICNLRDVTRSVNMQNQRAARSNNLSSGLLGAYRIKPDTAKRPWLSMISIDGKSKYLGCHETKEGAHEAYLKAKRAMHVGCTI